MAIEFENRLVAYIDILGWSQATKSMSAADLYETLKPLRLRGEYHNEANRQQLIEEHGDRVNPLMLEIQYTFFSDCFVFSMPTSMGGRIYDAISEIIREFLKRGLAVRGGITAGKLFHRDQVVFGHALLIAHRIENKEANFARVMVDENAIRATGIKQYFAIIKDHLGSWIVDPFPQIATAIDMREMLHQFFDPQCIIQVCDQKITDYAGQSRIRDIWRFQAEVCALSLEKYGDIANDWVTGFRMIAKLKTESKSIMSLTYGLASICDLYAKLLRDANALGDEVTSDRMFNFVLTGYSMIDWVKNDPSVPDSAKCSAAVDGLYSDKWLKICGDLATACKHFELKKRVPITAAATSDNGFGMGRYGKGGYGLGEESIHIELNDGTCYPCLDLVNGAKETWQRFFATHKICKASVVV